MYNSELLQEKWNPIINHKDLPSIKDNYRRAVTAVVLENQEKALREERPTNSFQSQHEATPANATGGSGRRLLSTTPAAHQYVYEITLFKLIKGCLKMDYYCLKFHYNLTL